MDRSQSEQSRLDQIAEEFSAAIRNGETPSVDDYVAQHGDSSGQLRRLLGSVAMLEGLKRDTQEVAKPGVTQSAISDRLDDYVIVREIGRGGMGVVYEAIHQSLGRRVAIKVLADRLLGDSKHLARFRREARAAANLRHPNIVPVFGVGTSGGHHYYVMDYIDGMSLQQQLEHLSGKTFQPTATIDEALAQTDGELHFSIPEEENSASQHSPADSTTNESAVRSNFSHHAKWVAQVGATICDALDYAHGKGVLHRDIKPANLLVDRQRDVWIADFGLAKLNEPQSVTMTGDVIGTPQYMPPESLEGHYDVASEVYAVGLTVYEMLTLTPAIAGRGAGDVLRRASEGISAGPRKANPDVPRDLDTIVLKALALDPSQRYETAGHMRDDLLRFLKGQPITARPIGRIERTVRWAKREPVVAGLTGSTFGLLLALAIVAAIAYAKTSSALSKATRAQAQAETLLEQRTEAYETAELQRRRAEANLQVALAGFDQIMNDLADRGLEPDAEFLGDFADTTSSGVTPGDAAILKSLLGFFDELAANNSEELLGSSAVAAKHAGDIYLRLGELKQADDAYSESLRRYVRLSESNDDDPSTVIAEIEIQNDLAMIAGLRGKIDVAGKMFQSACDRLEASPHAADTREGKFECARAHRLYASMRARAGMETPVSRRPGSQTRRMRPLERMLRFRAEDELQAVSEAIELLKELATEYPDDVGYQAELARAYRDRAIVAAHIGLRADSEGSVKRSIEIFEQLLQDNPESDAIRYELATTLASTEAFNLGQMMRFQRASQLSKALLAKSPALPRYQALHAQALQSLAAQQLRINRLRSAEDNLEESLDLYNQLSSNSSEVSRYDARRSGVLELLADLKLRQGDREAAIDYLERAIRRVQPKRRRGAASPIAQVQLARLKQKLGRIEDNP